MLIDPLAGFHFVGGGSGGGGGYAPANSATGLYYSPVEGFYDSISQTHLTGAAGDASGAGNPYEVDNDAPTTTGFVPASQPMNSLAPVGLEVPPGEIADVTSTGSGVPVYCSTWNPFNGDFWTWPIGSERRKPRRQLMRHQTREQPLKGA